MQRYGGIFCGVLSALLVLFLVVQALEVAVLTDPSPWLDRGGPIAALIGVGLLLLDIVLPIPSSIVMIAHGAMFGVAIGTMLSLIGSTGSAMAGFALGRRGGPLLSRHLTEADRLRADLLLRRWGLLAIIVTRPVPLVAETTAIMAGTSSLSWRQVLFGSAAGSLPAALLYSLTGVLAIRAGSGVIAFGLVIAIAGGVWLVGRGLAGASMMPPNDSGRQERLPLPLDD